MNIPGCCHDAIDCNDWNDDTIDSCSNGTCLNIPQGPTEEVCDGQDNDQDGSIDEDLGTTPCGQGACQTTVDNCVNGQPQACVPGNPSEEVCDCIDNDCDGEIDEGFVLCAGDFDRDGDVDVFDLGVFARDFGRTDCLTSGGCGGDFDHDGDVDVFDLGMFARDFGRTNCPCALP